MSFISTAFNRLGDFATDLIGGFTSLSPVIETGLDIAGRFGAFGDAGSAPSPPTVGRPAGAPGTPSPIGFITPNRPLAMPGGAPLMPSLPTSPTAMLTRGQGFGSSALDALQGQGFGASGRVINLTETGRVPKVNYVTDGNGNLVPLVRAPKAIYKVTVRQPRRCRGR